MHWFFGLKFDTCICRFIFLLLRISWSFHFSLKILLYIKIWILGTFYDIIRTKMFMKSSALSWISLKGSLDIHFIWILRLLTHNFSHIILLEFYLLLIFVKTSAAQYFLISIHLIWLVTLLIYQLSAYHHIFRRSSFLFLIKVEVSELILIDLIVVF